MKKIKLSKKLNLNKMVVSELNDANNIQGGGTSPLFCHVVTIDTIGCSGPYICRKKITITGCVPTMD